MDNNEEIIKDLIGRIEYLEEAQLQQQADYCELWHEIDKINDLLVEEE